MVVGYEMLWMVAGFEKWFNLVKKRTGQGATQKGPSSSSVNISTVGIFSGMIIPINGLFFLIKTKTDT